jgi:hypothetical protein
MIIGIINGGIGLQLAEASTGLIVAYAVVGVVVFLSYVAGAVRKEIMRQKGKKGMEQIDCNSSSALELMP